jgi:hypothetical protein
MEPTSVLLGVLLASTKGLAFAAIGFGVAWWRGRQRIAKLEAALPQADELADRFARLENTLDYTTGALERLLAGQDELRRGAEEARKGLPGPRVDPPTIPRAPEASEITPH